MFSYGFMQRAFVVGLAVGLACSLMSFFVVWRRLAFIGVGVSHAAFGGLALGTLLGVSPMVTAVVFSTASALGINALAARGVQADTAIGIFFSTAMALGMVFLSLVPGFTADLFSYLFGNILAVTSSDVVVIAILSFLAVVLVFLFWKELLFLSFDEEMARVHGLPTAALGYLLLSLLAITIVIAIKVVGAVLVAALLVLPGATASLTSRRYPELLRRSLAVGATSVTAGLVLSYFADLPSGATVVLVASAIFFACWGVNVARGGAAARAART
jgi:ABC-type Mn2+/Zn2+ transport system permease subunit